jgi:valyl-tRNA synthetase
MNTSQTQNSDKTKHYSPSEVESFWTDHWLSHNLFNCQIHPHKEKFSIALPPPNVTGELHMGHALGGTIQDILIRYNRMLGKDVLWQIGTDHAGIGTQIVVEKDLKKQESKTKEDLGRVEFIKRTQAWKESYGNKIIEQMKLMGFSPDYSRIRYTMDDHYAHSVQSAFIKYFDSGLIYKGKRITNWCPHCLTSLSDLEIEKEQINKKLYKIRYKLKTQPANKITQDFIVVATTRPETMFGDTAVAINPEDSRFSDLINLIRSQPGSVLALIPFSNKEIPVILDEHVKMDFGTGALKVTPAHDANDFEIALRHNLPSAVILDKTAKLKSCPEVPDIINIKTEEGFVTQSLTGLDRYKARDYIIQALGDALLATEEYAQEKDLHDRCNTEIEPYLSNQWYVSMSELAKVSLSAFDSGCFKFVPERYSSIFKNWLSEIKDWCISRQIWWGHQIPVFYYDDTPANTSVQELHQLVKSQKNCFIDDNDRLIRYYVSQSPRDPAHYQDPDVLDTWFSSALWPFETLKSEHGSLNSSDWDKKVYESFYPTSILATAREIINLWVTRMIFSSLFFEQDIPFRDILIHPVVQTPDGKRMSKSKGNAIDPLEMIAKYGADASRMWYASVGVISNQDVKFPGQKDKDKSWTSDTFEQYKKFANKLFNAFKFTCLKLNEDGGFVPQAPETWDKSKFNLADTWILNKFFVLVTTVNQAFEIYDLSSVQKSIYEFIWFDFCDWYIEAVKVKQGADFNTQKQILFYILEASLRLLHPIMPFITEELWQNLKSSFDFSNISDSIIDKDLDTKYSSSICFAKYPNSCPAFFEDKNNLAEKMEFILGIISQLRNTRQSLGISWANQLDIYYETQNSGHQSALESAQAFVQEMGKVAHLSSKPEHLARPLNVFVVDSTKFFVPLLNLVDIEKIKSGINLKITKLNKDILGLESRLNSPNFIQNASKEKITETKASLDQLLAQKQIYLDEISALS